jgi:hypothetical protein
MNIPWGQLVGAAVFAGVVLAAVMAIRWTVLALVDYDPHCVYEYDLTDGRIYVGYGKDPQARAKTHRAYQRRLKDDDPRNWWPFVPLEVRESMMPPRVTWYRSEAVAHQEERARIRKYDEAGQPLANGTKYKGVSPSV